MNMIRSFRSSISKPLVWKLTGFGSSIVGFSCCALSPSFRCLFKEWSPRKVVAYSVVSSLLSISMLFVKRCSLVPHGKNVLLKGHVGFVVLALTSLWSFWEDHCEQGKGENRLGKIMHLTSTGAFSLMALSLSRQLQLGLDVGVANFLLGCFLVTLMKMNLKLAPLAALFCYLLVNIRSISASLLLLRGRVAGNHDADDHEEEPSWKDLEANSNGLADYTTVAGEEELGEPNGAAVSPRSDEPKFQDPNANSDVFGSDTNEERSEEIEADSNVPARDIDEPSSQDPEANFDNFACETNETTEVRSPNKLLNGFRKSARNLRGRITRKRN